MLFCAFLNIYCYSFTVVPLFSPLLSSAQPTLHGAPAPTVNPRTIVHILGSLIHVPGLAPSPSFHHSPLYPLLSGYCQSMFLCLWFYFVSGTNIGAFVPGYFLVYLSSLYPAVSDSLPLLKALFSSYTLFSNYILLEMPPCSSYLHKDVIFLWIKLLTFVLIFI